MGIGRRLKEAREKRGFTQKELADLVGVTGAAITNYEKETSHPKEQVLYKLIDALDVDANFLFQDCVSTSPRAAPRFSPEAEALAAAYDRADEKSRRMARLALEDFMQPAAPRNVHDWTPDELIEEATRQVRAEEADRKKGTTESSTGSPNVSGADCA